LESLERERHPHAELAAALAAALERGAALAELRAAADLLQARTAAGRGAAQRGVRRLARRDRRLDRVGLGLARGIDAAVALVRGALGLLEDVGQLVGAQGRGRRRRLERDLVAHRIRMRAERVVGLRRAGVAVRADVTEVHTERLLHLRAVRD